MVQHLKEIVEEILQRICITKDDVVLDIGSNDGTTLSFYESTGCKRIGIDPTSSQFLEYYQKGITVIPDFFSNQKYLESGAQIKPKVITSIAMFYDLPNPNQFVADIQATLDPEGLWIFEQSYLPTMIEFNSFDTICHEHLEYYCLKPVKILLEKNGLQIIDVILNDANGGSFRITAAHQNASWKPNFPAINLLLKNEMQQGFLSPLPFKRLSLHIEKLKDQLISFLKDAKNNGKLVHGYGASTKGNTLLQLFDITADLLPAIADRNPKKFGLTTPGSKIPIISENDSRSLNPDYYLALPWHFRSAFLSREKDFLENGGQFVFPLPKFEVISKN